MTRLAAMAWLKIIRDVDGTCRQILRFGTLNFERPRKWQPNIEEHNP